MSSDEGKILDAIGELRQDVGKIEGKIDHYHDQLTQHDKRLGSVEKKQSWFIGVGAGLVAATAAVFEVFRNTN